MFCNYTLGSESDTLVQSLARFAQLLVREWVLRRLNGADFGVNVPSRSQA